MQILLVYERMWISLNLILADCCSEIKIVLKDVVLKKQNSKLGAYKIENDLVNKRRHWTSLDRNQAIWYTVATVLSAAAVGNFENYFEAISVGN